MQKAFMKQSEFATKYHTQPTEDNKKAFNAYNAYNAYNKLASAAYWHLGVLNPLINPLICRCEN